jgi:wobble nucleotide-excising tRNase
LFQARPFRYGQARRATKLIFDAIAEVNARIDQFNERIRNRKAEAADIKVEFWKRMRHDHASVANVYLSTRARLNGQVSSLDAELVEVRSSLATIAARLGVLRAHSVGTERSVEAINRRLLSLGIRAFKIKKKPGTDNLYCLERPDVAIEEYKSLSEGEKTLIAFFYFVELVNGSAMADTHLPQDKKIVVIDDPISSLSHNYIYDIASIIVNEIIGGDQKVLQVIVLTHSLFFHHEMIKQISNGGISQYFRVLKSECSSVRKMAGNEVLNDYQAFWQVLKDARDNHGSIASVPNAMRCILEHFFSFTEEHKTIRTALKELGESDHTFTPLGRFLDKRSHADAVNLTDFGEVDINYYLSKFKLIFERTNYPAHYAKMMGEEEPARAVPPAPGT